MTVNEEWLDGCFFNFFSTLLTNNQIIKINQLRKQVLVAALELILCAALQLMFLLQKQNRYFSIYPPGNRVVTVWPRHRSSSAATHWRTTMTSHSHQTWFFSASQRAAWVYASVGSACVMTPHLFSLSLIRTQESPAMESASTSTVPFSEDITVLVGRKVATQRRQQVVSKWRRPWAKGLMGVAEARPLRCLHLKVLSQHLHQPLEKRATNSLVPS